jgi:hypothetical protein
MRSVGRAGSVGGRGVEVMGESHPGNSHIGCLRRMAETEPQAIAEPAVVGEQRPRSSSIAFAIRYDGRKRVHHADGMMARIPADRLVRPLEASGFVLMKGPSAPAPNTSGMPRSGSDAG